MQHDGPSNGGHTIVINIASTAQPPAININGAPAACACNDSVTLAEVRAHLEAMYRQFAPNGTTPPTHNAIRSALRHAGDLAWPTGNAPY